jgi:hypothetical protein
MDSFVPVLGISMMVFGLIVLLACLGGLVYWYWPRSRSGVGQSRTNPETVQEVQSREAGL